MSENRGTTDKIAQKQPAKRIWCVYIISLTCPAVSRS